MDENFKAKNLYERIEEIAVRAYSQGGTDNLRLALDALVVLQGLPQEAKPEPIKETKRK